MAQLSRMMGRCVAGGVAVGLAAMLQCGVQAAEAPLPPSTPTYADLVALAESAPLVVEAEVRTVAPLKDGQGAAPSAGHARAYIEARPIATLRGAPPVAQAWRYLADVPLDARGKPVSLKKREVILFARGVSGGNGELQLVAPTAQLIWGQELEDRVRHVFGDLAAADAPGVITGIGQALFEPGNLVGEGETQIFLTTKSSQPASITVLHSPNAPTRWTASFSEVVDTTGGPPAKDTLAWYRLACSLPANLPARVNIGETDEARQQAAADYAMVLSGLGPCKRTIK